MYFGLDSPLRHQRVHAAVEVLLRPSCDRLSGQPARWSQAGFFKWFSLSWSAMSAIQSVDGAAATRKPRFPVAESGVFELRAETR